MVSVSVDCLFYQAMDEKIKSWSLRFPAKENPNMKKALIDWPVVYDVKAKYRFIPWDCLWHSHGKNPVRLYPKLQSQPKGLPKIFIDYLFFQDDYVNFETLETKRL